MHLLVQENLEELLKGCSGEHPASRHLTECAECREEVAAMRVHALVLREWRAPAAEPRAGFYARVIERIEASTPRSIWNVFFESIFGRRLALASLSLALLLGLYLVTAESNREPDIAFSDNAVEMLPVPVVTGQFVAMHDSAGVMLEGAPDEDSVLVNLVTYQEQ